MTTLLQNLFEAYIFKANKNVVEELGSFCGYVGNNTNI